MFVTPIYPNAKHSDSSSSLSLAHSIAYSKYCKALK